jgi:hypothetical protein
MGGSVGEGQSLFLYFGCGSIILKEFYMAGTAKGGKLAAKTNKTKHGTDFYARIGAMGGKKLAKRAAGVDAFLVALRKLM